MQFFTEDSLNFQERISQRNGLGNATSLPPSLHEEPPLCNMVTAREEAELVLFGAVQEVLDKTGASILVGEARLSVLLVVRMQAHTHVVYDLQCSLLGEPVAHVGSSCD